jgi:hypothetical protein
MVIQTTYTHTDLISFVFAPSLLYFCSKYVIRYICFGIRIWSVSALLQISDKKTW